MRRYNCTCIDNKTNHRIIFSDCTYNMACHELTCLFGEKNILSVKKNYTDNLIYITVFNSYTNKNVTYVWDDERSLLLMVE